MDVSMLVLFHYRWNPSKFREAVGVLWWKERLLNTSLKQSNLCSSAAFSLSHHGRAAEIQRHYHPHLHHSSDLPTRLPENSLCALPRHRGTASNLVPLLGIEAHQPPSCVPCWISHPQPMQKPHPLPDVSHQQYVPAKLRRKRQGLCVCYHSHFCKARGFGDVTQHCYRLFLPTAIVICEMPTLCATKYDTKAEQEI